MAKSLLLADDSVTIHKMVELSFTQEDFAIAATRSVDEALARARENSPDIILADTFMPDRNGYDLAEAIRADPSLAHVPVVLLVSPSAPFDEGRAQAAGAVGWISKPFQSTALLEQVKKAFAPKPVATPPAPEPVAVVPPREPTPAPVVQPISIPPVHVPTPGPATTISPAVRTAPTPPPIPADVSIPPPPRVSPPPRAVVPQRPGAVASGRSKMPPRPAVSGPRATGGLTAQNHEALLREALTQASREMIEKIAWEVVPELAETLIKEELERLMKQRQGG